MVGGSREQGEHAVGIAYEHRRAKFVPREGRKQLHFQFYILVRKEAMICE